mgnify:CR=1 FL=1
MPVHKTGKGPASDVLRAVELALIDVLGSPGGGSSGVPDDPMVRHIVLTILRRRATLDWLIDAASTGRVRPRVRRGLWWALAEALYLDGLPAAVAVDTLVGSLRRKSPVEARFANALCRSILAPGRDAVLQDVRASAPAWVALDLGQELYACWSERLDREHLGELALLLQEPAPVVCRWRRPGVSPPLDGLQRLPPFPWAPDSELLLCTSPAVVFRSEAWQRHDMYVQDPSTLLAPTLLGGMAGEVVADLCCAPGGKALMLSEAVGASGRVVCMDRSPQRLQRVLENLAGVSNCRVVAGDACAPPLKAATFAAVLLDVPCSNTGVVRRRPDVRWHFTRKGRDEVARLQARILRGAADLVCSGGRLVYSTCSIEPEENGMQVRMFLAEHPDFHWVSEHELLPGPLHDGAYAALLRRD